MATIEVFSDVICPWCYIGGRRLQRATDIVHERTGRRFHVRHRAFELNPEMPLSGVSRRSYRTTKFGSWQRSQQLDDETVSAGRADGIVFDYDAISVTPNSRAAHRLIALSERETGQGMQLADRLMTAYFAEGRDLGAPDVLARIGQEMNLGSDLIARLSDPALEMSVVQDGALAERRGVLSVPVFVAGDRVITGAVSIETLSGVLERHAAALPGEAVDGG